MGEYPDTSSSDRGGRSSGGDFGDNGASQERYSAGEELRKSGRESPFKAFFHIGLVVALCVGGAGAYWWWVQGTLKINELVKEARDLQKADDFASLNKAYSKYNEAMQVRENNRSIAALANVTASLWGMHGIEAMKAEAEKYVAMAKERDIPNGDRFASEGYMMVFNNDPAGCEKHLKSVLDRGAQDPKVLHAIGLALMVQGRTREARIAFGKAIDLSAGEARYSVSNADAYFRDGEYSNAFAFYKRAAVANAEHARARTGKLLAEAKQGGKLPLLDRSIKSILEEPEDRLSPSDKNFAQYTAAEIAFARGKHAEASKFVAEALAKNDQDPRLHYLKGHLLNVDEKLDEALKEFDRALELDPYTAAYYFDVAEILREAGRPSEAVTRIRLYGNKNFKSEEYKFHLASALVDKGDFAEAEQILNKLLEKNDHDPDALFLLGYSFELQQKWAEAREKYGTADQYRQGWGDPWYRMGYVAIGEKDYATARQYFDEADKRYKKANAPRKKRGKAMMGIVEAFEKEGKARKAKPIRAKAQKFLK